MSILTIFVVIPVLMLLGLWLARTLNQVRTVMVVGASLLLVLSIYLTIDFIHLRQTIPAEVAPMLYTASIEWFKPLHICYSVGVDGISVVMLLLSSIIVFTGTFASWQLKPLTKEYFLWFTLLSSGVYGFFICTD
ncbi:MAG: NADH-quinone oxidoreductase subunit M, partial [Prevotella sp.]|nr:NADH-quinone oxidoreductase subunit M [Prevotella sp.]